MSLMWWFDDGFVTVMGAELLLARFISLIGLNIIERGVPGSGS